MRQLLPTVSFYKFGTDWSIIESSQMRDMGKATGSAGRPREFDEADVLGKVMSLFWEKGYEGTGLSDIMAATGLHKGSLYKAFGSKHELYVRALDLYEQQIIDAAVDALKSGGDPVQRLRIFLRAPIDAVWNKNDRRGCFLCNASADQAAGDPKTQALVVRGYAKLEGAINVAVGDARPDWPQTTVGQVARLLLSVYSGLRVMARAPVERHRLQGAMDAALALLSDAEAAS